MNNFGSMPYQVDMFKYMAIGKWAYELDEGKEPRMYCDEIMLDLLGITDELTPEEIFRTWHSAIDPDHMEEVNKTIRKVVSGEYAVVQYPWYHPKKGRIYVRCSGVRNDEYKAGVRIEGIHEDITDVILNENKTKATLKEDLQAIQGLASEYNVLHFLNIKTDEYVSYFFDPTSPDDAVRMNNDATNYYDAHKESIPVFCYPDHLERIMQYGDKDFLINSLLHKKKVVERFLCMNAAGKYEWVDFIILKFDPIDEEPTRVAIGYVNVQEDQIEKLEHERMKKESEAQLAIIRALSSMYITMLEIDVETKQIRVIRIPDFMKDRFQVDGANYDQIKEPYIQMCVASESHEAVRQFLEFDTLVERLHRNGYMQINYLGRTEGWCRITMVPVKRGDSEEIDKIVFAVASIQEEKQREANMQYQAEHDELTGVLNRTAYRRLEAEMAINDHPMAMMIMDIDHFKDVNDTYGHDVGDEVLRHVSRMLQRSFRQRDHVVRYGGDEFVVVFSECSEGFEARIQEIIAGMNESLQHPKTGDLPPVSVSAGVARFDGPYDEKVLKKANNALYYTKQHGRAGCTFFDPSLQ